MGSPATAQPPRAPTPPSPALSARAAFYALCNFLLLLAAGITLVQGWTFFSHVSRFIPAGAIRQVSPVKGGQKLVLDTGDTVVFPGDVLGLRPDPITLKPGDTVAKADRTLNYFVNDQRVDDARSILRRTVLATPLVVLLGLYFSLSSAYTLAYGVLPILDQSQSRKRPATPPATQPTTPPAPLHVRLPGILLKLCLTWLLAILLLGLLLSLAFGCLRAILIRS